MEITRMMTIAENGKVNIKQTDCGQVYLYYDNVRIYFNKGAFLNFLIEVDNWCIKKENGQNSELMIKASRFSLKIKDEDIDTFIESVRTAAYNIIPVLSLYKKINSNNEFLKNRIN
ncbi:MAG: hypothetical protein PVH88_09365 [Ignavibacteria bacterium]|jgi:hypothetical protein